MKLKETLNKSNILKKNILRCDSTDPMFRIIFKNYINQIIKDSRVNHNIDLVTDISACESVVECDLPGDKGRDKILNWVSCAFDIESVYTDLLKFFKADDPDNFSVKDVIFVLLCGLTSNGLNSIEARKCLMKVQIERDIQKSLSFYFVSKNKGGKILLLSHIDRLNIELNYSELETYNTYLDIINRFFYNISSSNVELSVKLDVVKHIINICNISVNYNWDENRFFSELHNLMG